MSLTFNVRYVESAATVSGRVCVQGRGMSPAKILNTS